MMKIPDFKFLKELPKPELDDRQKKILLMYFAGLIACVIFYFFVFFRPGLARLGEILPKAKKIKKDINEVRDDMLYEDKLKKKTTLLYRTQKKYENKLSREKEIPLLLENMSKMARASRVKILGVTPNIKDFREHGPGEGSYQEVPIAISAQAGYHDLGIFINKIEEGERFMQISDIKIKSNTANPNRHDIEFVVYAYTFTGE